MTRSRLFLILTFIAFGSAWGHSALAWWNDDWAFRKEIKFDLAKTGADIPGSPQDVPVLIRLSLANFSYFGDTAPDGADLRFIAADDKTPLKHHVERYDPQAQIAFVWVRVPRLTGGANTDKIFLYYGNKKAQQGGDAGGTYDKNQVLVYHFGAAAGSPQDATSYKTDPSDFKAVVSPASLIASGVQFNGAETITTPSTPALHLTPAQGMTVSAWVRIEAAQSRAYVVALQDSGKEFVLGINGAQAFATLAGATVTQTAGTISTGEWHHLAARAGNGRVDLF
ncbi:MAG TPA: DUF2341 domain-containing protein, partial [Steroidobacteraceae bacterium]